MSDPDHPRDRWLYRLMLLARRIDEDVVALNRRGAVPVYAPIHGQEATQVGSAAALDPERDFVFPTYRDLGVAVAMGVAPRATWRRTSTPGTAARTTRPRSGSPR